MSDRCRGCGREILWALHVSGKRAPLDPTPTDNGTYRLTANANPAAVRAEFVPKDERVGRLLYTPHHATCPKAAAFRKPTPKKETDRAEAPTQEAARPSQGPEGQEPSEEG